MSSEAHDNESSVSKAPTCPFANRPQLQRAILEYLASLPPVAQEWDQRHRMTLWNYNASTVTTGQIIDAIGRRRDKKGYASVSRSLGRMWKDGVIVGYQGPFATRGGGFMYALRRGEPPPGEAGQQSADFADC